MDDGVGCTNWDRVRPAVPFGQEDHGRFAEHSLHCHDCGAAPGQLHHARCDVERCPICGGQLITCGHDVQEPIRA